MEIQLVLFGIENKYKDINSYIRLKNKLVKNKDNNILISYNDISNCIIGKKNIAFEHIENNGFKLNIEIYNKKDNIQLIITKSKDLNIDLVMLNNKIIKEGKKIK